MRLVSRRRAIVWSSAGPVDFARSILQKVSIKYE